MTHNIPNKLESLRKEIDSLDESLLKVLAKRQRVVKEIISNKMGETKAIRDPKREEHLLRKIRELAIKEDVDPYYAEQLFRDVIFQSVRYQAHTLIDYQNESKKNRIKIAFQGDMGSFSHQAAVRHYQERSVNTEFVGFHTFEEVAEVVENSDVDLGILPIENTSAGSINDTYSIVSRDSLHIVGEEIIRVKNCLAAVKAIEIENIRRILAHPFTINQCSRFLSNMPRISIETFIDSGMAARKVFEEADLSQAAIISPFAAQYYNLEIIDADVADHAETYTRFVLISKTPITTDPQLPSKISLLLTTVHEKGALINCLKVFEKYDVNMTKLESRPRSDKPWQYQFYIDIDGNINEMRISDALKELDSKAASLKILGCYPRQDVTS